MKGWKTVLIFAVIALAGWFEQLATKLEACKVAPAKVAAAIADASPVINGATDVITLCEVGFPGWVVGVIGFIGIGLRFLSTTPIFKNWGAK